MTNVPLSGTGVDSKSQWLDLNKRKSTLDQLVIEDELGLGNDLWQIFWAHSSNSFMFTVNFNPLHCNESSAVVGLLIRYYKEDLDKKQKCRQLAILT